MRFQFDSLREFLLARRSAPLRIARARGCFSSRLKWPPGPASGRMPARRKTVCSTKFAFPGHFTRRERGAGAATDIVVLGSGHENANQRGLTAGRYEAATA